MVETAGSCGPRVPQGVTKRTAVEAVFLVAVMVIELFIATARVVTVNVAVVFPAVTVTLAGTVATAVRLLDRVTTVPPAGAAPVSVTVPVDGVPPFTVVGFRVSEAMVGACTTKLTLRVTP